MIEAIVGVALVCTLVAILTGSLLHEKNRAERYRRQLIDNGIVPLEEPETE